MNKSSSRSNASPSSLLEFGDLFMRSKRSGAADTLYRRFIAEYPDDYRGYLKLGLLYASRESGELSATELGGVAKVISEVEEVEERNDVTSIDTPNSSIIFDPHQRHLKLALDFLRQASEKASIAKIKVS
jgi:hypothetical protein